MADLDTTSKRRSSVQIFSFSVLASPAPTGTLDQADRQHIASSYSGILAAGTGAFKAAWARFANAIIINGVQL